VIRIKKNIPIAAGLGGGSSNAATTLIGLNKLWNLKLSKKKLCDLGATLGSDVPFFILEARFAMGCGRGEILQEMKMPHLTFWHCLVKPNFGISTKKAYETLDQSSLTPQKVNVRILLHTIQKGHSAALSKLLTNSLECAGHSTAPADVPQVRTRGLEQSLNNRVTEILEIKKSLMRQHALGCLLSGSGPTVFGIYSSQKKALQAARILRKNKRWKVFVASTY
jgi:4-diphosphocytidyl-2-C-methyl-D-erythritol kinase